MVVFVVGGVVVGHQHARRGEHRVQVAAAHELLGDLRPRRLALRLVAQHGLAADGDRQPAGRGLHLDPGAGRLGLGLDQIEAGGGALAQARDDEAGLTTGRHHHRQGRAAAAQLQRACPPARARQLHRHRGVLPGELTRGHRDLAQRRGGRRQGCGRAQPHNGQQPREAGAICAWGAQYRRPGGATSRCRWPNRVPGRVRRARFSRPATRSAVPRRGERSDSCAIARASLMPETRPRRRSPRARAGGIRRGPAGPAKSCRRLPGRSQASHFVPAHVLAGAAAPGASAGSTCTERGPRGATPCSSTRPLTNAGATSATSIALAARDDAGPASQGELHVAGAYLVFARGQSRQDEAPCLVGDRARPSRIELVPIGPGRDRGPHQRACHR